MAEQILTPSGVSGLDELVKGFPRGGLILISGNPGAGKTALASAFIYNGAVKHGEPGVYASLIEDEKSFYQFMRGFGYDFEELAEKRLFKYLALPSFLEAGAASTVNMIFETAESIGAKRIVIDSYTAVSQTFKNQAEARSFLHMAFSRISKQLGCTTMMIKEERLPGEKREYGFEDFIADVVIHLKTGRLDDKLIRELTVIKARGSEVRSPDAVFTLHHGFKALPPIRPLKPEKIRKVELPRDPPGGYTTGIPDLDNEIGGYPAGSTILLEISSKLVYREYGSILAPIVVNFLLKKRPCVVVPSGGVTAGDVYALGKLYGLSEEYIKKYLYMVLEEGASDNHPSNLVYVRPDENIAEKITALATELTSRFGSPPVMVYGIDRVVRVYGEKALDLMHLAQDRVRRRGGLAVWLLKPTYPWLSERLAPIADMHFKMTRRHGCVIFYGIKPRTPLYAVRAVEDNPVPRLVPIV